MSEVPTAGAGRSPHAIAALLEDPEVRARVAETSTSSRSRTPERARRLEDEKPRGEKP